MSWICEEWPLPLAGDCADAWDRLAEDGVHPHIQTTRWWVEVWLEHFASDGVRVLAFRRDRDVRALLPMWERRERDPRSPVSHRVLSPAGDGFTDALPLLVRDGDGEAMEQVAAWLDDASRHVHEARLLPLIEGTASYPLAERLAARGWERQRVEGNPLLDLSPGWEALERAVGKNLRHDVAKKKRRLAEAGHVLELTLETCCDTTLLAGLTELSRLRFQAEGHKSSLLDPARRAFIGQVGRLASERGAFACYTCREEGRLVAYRLGFLHRGAFFDWITSYDPAFFPFSIGKLMLWDVVEDLCLRGVKRLDFMAGEEDYKLKWNPEVRGMWRLRHRRPGLVNALRDGVRALGRMKAAWKP
jgi:CelD/BcsL family acetyltransferase involved in cellulose biosynthesis